MRVIQSRIFIRFFGSEEKSINRTALLVWYLSAIRWRKLGYTPVFYADETIKQIMDEYFLTELYDEINVDMLNAIDEEKVNKTAFWAVSKLLSFANETEPCIVSDIDIVPWKDPIYLINTNDIVCFKKEFPEMFAYDIKPEEISVPEGYRFPGWFSWKAQPLNAGIMYIKNNRFKKLYLDEAFKYIENNHNDKTNSNTITMCFAEQRIIGEIAETFKQKVGCYQPPLSRAISKDVWHTYRFKTSEDTDDFHWNMHYLKTLRDEDELYFTKIIQLPIFSDLKEYIDEYGWEYQIPEIFKYIEKGGMSK